MNSARNKLAATDGLKIGLMMVLSLAVVGPALSQDVFQSSPEISPSLYVLQGSTSIISDPTLEPIAAEEPVPPPGFPPLPLILDIMVPYQTYEPYSPGHFIQTGAQTMQGGSAPPSQVMVWGNTTPVLQGATNGHDITDAQEFLKAEKCIRDGKFDDAIEIGERCYFKQPNWPIAELVALAYKKLGQADLSQMWSHMQPPVAKIPNDKDEHTAQAKQNRHRQHSNSDGSAKELSKHAIKLGSRGKWQESIDEHELALKGDPSSAELRTNLSAAHMQFGKSLLARGQNTEAINQFRKALFVVPTNIEADRQLSAALDKIGKHSSDDLEYRWRIGEDAELSGNYETAAVECGRVARIKDSGLYRSQYGMILLRAGKTEEGYKELKAAVSKVWSETAEERLALSDTHRQLGDVLIALSLKAKNDGQETIGKQRLANAAVEYRRAVTCYPANGAALQGLIRCGQMAVAIKPSFDNHLFMGGAYLLAGKLPNAQMEYQESYRLKPSAPELSTARTAFHQAVARSPLSSMEQVADSVAKVKKLIDDDPEAARYWYILGRLRERQCDFVKAEKCYQKAMSINPLIDPDLKPALIRIGARAPEPSSSSSQNKSDQSKQENTSR